MRKSAGAAAWVPLVLLAAAPSGCGGKGDRHSQPASVHVDGSSTVYLISASQARSYQRAGFGFVAVGESGTTGGFRKFCKGEIDVTGASRPINQKEMDACKGAAIDFVELPIGYDGIAVVVHARNSWVDHLTVGELRTMWEAGSEIKSWSQVRPGFPDRPLRLYGPGTDSGTYDYFTLAINGKERSSRTDYTGSEDDYVLARGVIGDENGLAVFGYAYYLEHWQKLKLLAIDDGIAGNGQGPIPPSQESVSAGTYQPLSRPIFIYVSVKSAQRREVDHFVNFYLDHARKLVADAGYIALPERIDALVKARYQERRTGSALAGGSELGVTVDKLLAAERK